ncbi:MAG: hypothetical protein QOF78_1616 [Phycisphaerales bacterium]|jgi:hypothetical protein|nr:hypothetical protein [Phycisphaerales bacterium]
MNRIHLVALLFLLGLSAPVLAQSDAKAQATTSATQAAEDPPEKNDPVVNPMRKARTIKKLKLAPLYSFNEKDVDAYLKFLADDEKDPIRRVMHLARKNIGQPYQIFLLGEGPHEVFDPDPMYCLDKSDCVTFVEHTYAMALSRDWPGFFRTLQRLRYKEGKVGMVTRNHESVADWNVNNGWLFEEITPRLGDGKAASAMHLLWKPAKFFAQYNIGQDLPDVTISSTYIPREQVASILPELKDGDVAQIVRGNKREQYVGHFGLVARGKEGVVNMIHSAEPAVREQGILDYLEKNPKTIGFKFLRAKAEPQTVVDAAMK